MIIGIDIREWQPGVRTGIGRFLEGFLCAAAAGIRDDNLILFGDSTCEVRVQERNISIVRVPARWTPWWDQVSLPRQLARHRVSVLLSPYYKAPLRAPCPVVLTIHDLFFIGYPGCRRPFYDAIMTRLARLYTRGATAIIADSEYSKRSILEKLGINPAKISVIPLPLGSEFQKQQLTNAVKFRYGITEPYILYVGAFMPHKNLPRLLQAFAGLGASLRNTFQLVLAGCDQHHRPGLQELARTLGLSSRILFPGQIADPDLPALYSGCALFVLPSLEEGFGLPALEAMACGAPVIAANRAAIPEVVGKAAILFDPENITTITKTMTDVLTQPELGMTLRRLGLLRSREFSLSRTAGRVLTLLQEVSEGRYETRRTP